MKRRGVLRLEKVLGFTVEGNCAVDTNPTSDDVAYASGCIVVVYSPSRNKQLGYMRSLRPVSCLRYSYDGLFLAVGEQGEGSSLTVWSITGHRQMVQLSGHAHGVACLAFSPSGSFLVSIGQDVAGGLQKVLLWDWRDGRKVIEQPYSGTSINAVDFMDDETHIITGGNKSIRYWSVERDGKEEMVGLTEHRAGLMPEYKSATLTDVRCGRGSALGEMAFGVTACGALICFGMKRTMEKWVLLEAESAHCLALDESAVICGCSNGIIRLFNPLTLEFIDSIPQKNTSCVLAVQKADDKVLAFFGDKTISMWELSIEDGEMQCSADPISISVQQRPACCITPLPLSKDSNHGVFATCSMDNTVSFWKMLKRHHVPEHDVSDLIRSIEVRSAVGKSELSCVALASTGFHMAVGDSVGVLRVLETHDGSVAKEEKCHDGPILSACFSPTSLVLATAGQDGVINIFAGKSFRLSSSIRSHKAAIQRVFFTVHGDYLISVCLGGKVSVAHITSQQQGGQQVQGKLEIAVEEVHSRECGAIDVAVDATNQFFACACIGQRLEICSTLHGNVIRSYELDFGCKLICFDPAKLYLAVLSDDNVTIRLIDFYSGDCLGKASGHGSTVTALAFGNDCKRLISSSNDGCMFVWRVHPDVTKSMRNRLLEMESHSKENEAPNAAPEQLARSIEEDMDTVVIASDDENAASNDVDNATESSQISSALTAPRTPPKPPDLPRSLAKERDAQKLQEAVSAVERMRSRLKKINILESTRKAKPQDQEESKERGEGGLEEPLKLGLPETTESSSEKRGTIRPDHSPHTETKSESQVEKSSEPGASTPDKKAIEEAVLSPAAPTETHQATTLQADSVPQRSDVSGDKLPTHHSTHSSFPSSDKIQGVIPLEASQELDLNIQTQEVRPVRSASEAREACASSLRSLGVAFNNTLAVLGEVHNFESTLAQKMESSQDSLTKEALAESRDRVREVLGGFSIQLEGMVKGQLESVKQSAKDPQAFRATQSVSASFFGESNTSMAGSNSDILVLKKLEDIATLIKNLGGEAKTPDKR